MKYTVTYDDGKIKGSYECDAPERLPQCGDVYEWTRPTSTLGGYHYREGDRMTVLERTGHAPFHRRSSLGNLLVRSPFLIQGKYYTSVWTCFEACIADGALKLVENP